MSRRITLLESLRAVISRRKAVPHPHSDPQPQLVAEVRELVEAIMLLRDAVRARDRHTASEAIAALLPQFMVTFGHDDELMREAVLSLARLRKLFLAGQFSEAEPIVLAWLLRLHQTADALNRALTPNQSGRPT
jgi:hypothetical protein